SLPSAGRRGRPLFCDRPHAADLQPTDRAHRHLFAFQFAVCHLDAQGLPGRDPARARGSGPGRWRESLDLLPPGAAAPGHPRPHGCRDHRLSVCLTGATVMTTPTQRVLDIAREDGYAGIEARAERLLTDPAEVRATAEAARPNDVLTLNGVALTVRADGRVDRQRVDADLGPRLRICTDLGSPYLLAIPPRAPGLSTRKAIPGTRDALELARDRADAMGIRIAFEFLGFGDCPINTPA